MIGPTSGLAGIAYWINENYQLPPSQAVRKQDPLVVALKEWVDEMYAAGRQAAMSVQEMETKIEELTGGRLARL